jgi:hypothetical protein
MNPLRTFALAALFACTAAQAAPPAKQPAIGGYLFATFKTGNAIDSEQIYLGLSHDGIHWDALNNGNPVLISTLGEKGVRDPYLLRAHDGKKFFLIATDLNINLSKDWKRARTAGSKSMVVWESRDLIHWSAPRLVKIAPDDAGNTWAPEAIYDEETHDYMVYWASTTSADDHVRQRIWASHTKEFKTFSKPEIYIEKPASIFDTDIVREGDTYYRFSVDTSPGKDIIMESAPKLSGPWTDVPGYNLGALHGSEGPAGYQLPSPDGTTPGKWVLLLDFSSSGHGYRAFTTPSLASGAYTPDNDVTFPFVFRHGSVLALTPTEYQHLRTANAATNSPRL